MSDDKEDKHGKAIGEFVEATFAGFMFGGDKDQIPMKKLRTTMRQGLNARKDSPADHATRMRALDMAIKIAGGYPAQKVDHTGEVEHVVKDQLTPAVQEVFEKIVKRDKK